MKRLRADDSMLFACESRSLPGSLYRHYQVDRIKPSSEGFLLLQYPSYSSPVTLSTMEACYEAIANALVDSGYAIVPDFMLAVEIQDMLNELECLRESRHMHLAGVGQGAERVSTTEVRGDFISWLDFENPSLACSGYFSRLKALKQSLNRSLMLGLFDFEGHYAAYPPGAFYKRHLDQFQNDSHRTVTCILYLNRHWKNADGGQLRMYLDDDDTYIDIEPTGGTLVVFMSSRFWHEVLPAGRDRFSLTGWFKTRSEALF